MKMDQHIVLGTKTQIIVLSFRNSFKYGPFSLSFLIDHKEGGHAINLANLIYDLGGTTADFEDNGGDRLANLGSVTAPYVESTTYTALRDLSLTYNLGSLGERLGINDLQVGLALKLAHVN